VVLTTDVPLAAGLARKEGAQLDFEKLAEAERAGLIRFARGMLADEHEAEDVAQEALLRLCRAWGRAREARPYLYKTIANLCMDRLRRRGRSLPPERAPQLPPPAEAGERREAVRRALEQLGAHERAAVLLRETEGLSYREIGAALEATVAQVTNWIHRGKNRLRELLAPYIRKGEIR
jgi:RNA polymerase sigma-70 factor (ECF subfamily)